MNPTASDMLWDTAPTGGVSVEAHKQSPIISHPDPNITKAIIFYSNDDRDTVFME